MKVYINREPVQGPWGGGNKFVKLLSEHIKNLKHTVTYDLTSDVDVIFCFDPRPNSKGMWYQDFLEHRHIYGSKIIQRVGDVGTHSKPDLTRLVMQSTVLSDFVIFPSNWAKNYINYTKDNYKIIENAPLSIFHKNKIRDRKIEDKIRVVTHHWSTNEKKGFDFYQFLGEKINNKSLKNVEFTFIGRFNDNYLSAGISLINPIGEKQLSEELPKHDVYLTASLEEAGANHVLEAIACGLPVLYRKDGGSIQEYCKSFGFEYDHNFNSLVNSLQKICDNFENIKKNCLKYQNTIEDCVSEYWEIICKI